jgi:hypothetical protein
MAARKKPIKEQGLFAYGQQQMKENGSTKLFAGIGDINPALRESPKKRGK